MSILSYSYLVFLPVTLLLWYVLRRIGKNRMSGVVRNAVLLLACWFFYAGGKLWQLPVLVILTALSYGSALWMECMKRKHARVLFVASVIINLAVLCTFKYLSFFLNQIGITIVPLISGGSLPIPAGLSFYTLEIIAYLSNVFHGREKAERNPVDYAVFVSFFPTIMSGPIERPDRLIPQLKSANPLNTDDIYVGLRRIVSGIFRKMVIADQLALLTDEIFNHAQNYSGLSFALAALAFTVQIYCDFSGYSEIAIGSARLLGIRLGENFDLPYFSKSIKEFWRRWHISLSSWFRDYLYIPLGGSRHGLMRTCLNVMIVFLVSGLWHGAGWTFIFWGALHGLYQIVESLLHLDKDAGQAKGSRTLLVFLLVTFAWIPFRANSLSDYGYILRNMLMPNIETMKNEFHTLVSMGFDRIWLAAMFVAMVLFLAQELYRKERRDSLTDCQEVNPVCAIIFSALLLAATLFFGVYGPMYSARDFIYYQF